MGFQQIRFKNISFSFAIREKHTFLKDYTGFILNIKRYVYLFYGLLQITGFGDIDGKSLSVVCSPPQHPELKSLQTVFESLRADLEPHLLNEKRVLFPLIVKLERYKGYKCKPQRGQFGSSSINRTRELLNQMAKGYVGQEDDCQSFCYKRVPLKIP
jgi:hypothetical protein